MVICFVFNKSDFSMTSAAHQYGLKTGKLPPPELFAGQNAMVNFTSHLDTAYALRGPQGASGTTHPAIIAAGLCGSMLQVGSLLNPWTKHVDNSGVVDYEYSLILPDGPSPDDATGAGIHTPDIVSPIGVAVYGDRFTRYLVMEAALNLTFHNHSANDYYVGVLVHVGKVYYDATNFVEGSEIGDVASATSFIGIRPEYAKQLPNLKYVRINGVQGMPSQDITDSGAAGGANVWNSKSMSATIPRWKLLNEVTDLLQGDQPDIGVHGGIFNSLGDPSADEWDEDITVWLVCFPVSSGLIDYEGTSTIADDDTGRVICEDFHASDVSNVRSWTKHIRVSGSMVQRTLLYDPIVLDNIVTITPLDVNTA